MIRARAKLHDDRRDPGCREDVPARRRAGRRIAVRICDRAPANPPNGTLVVYSPGYEDQPVGFSKGLSFAWIPFAEPVLCIRSIGGPFEFNIYISPIEDAD
jgi:hypothetical protein